MCGLPSVTLLILLTSWPRLLIYSAVPPVAIMSKPLSTTKGISLFKYFLSESFTLIKIEPDLGRILFAPFWALA